MNFITEIILAVAFSSSNAPMYKILYNGQIFTCNNYQYNDVGCIQFIENSSGQEVKFCNNFLVIPQ